MGAEPKTKLTKGRRDRRRSHMAIRGRNFSRCRQCRSLVPSHQVCPVCGYYRTTEIIHREQPQTKYR